MRRIRQKRITKKAITLVELIVALVLMTLFVSSCVLLIYPITSIYTSVNNTSRAQLLADTVIDELRLECSHTYIKEVGDVWIASEMTEDGKPGDFSTEPGDVLVIRRSEGYVESIYSDYVIPAAACAEIVKTDEALQNSNVTSRAVYRLFSIPENINSSNPIPNNDLEVGTGIVHYGYYTYLGGKTDDNTSYAAANDYYDYTNPIPLAAYSISHTSYSVRLVFHDITCSDSEQLPAYVLCDVIIVSGAEEIYTRNNVVLCFA